MQTIFKQKTTAMWKSPDAQPMIRRSIGEMSLAAGGGRESFPRRQVVSSGGGVPLRFAS